MKLTISGFLHRQGFALPTILLVSVVMLAVLAASIAAAGGSRVALDSQYYNELAKHAAEAGIARANECLKGSGWTPQWSDASPLKPATACTGTGTAYSAYVVSDTNMRTYFSVDAPSGSGIGSNLKVTGTTELIRTSGTQDVWRKYDYVTYLRIEPPQTVTCSEGFIPVPGNPTFGTSDFCVAKYETKVEMFGNGTRNGMAVSTPLGMPYVKVSQYQAIAASAAACNGCHLITEAEWLTVAHNVLNVASNWTGGAVGSGSMYVGHTDNSPNTFLEAQSNDTQGYYGTGNVAPSNQRRTLTLSNGEVIWDMSGNAFEWTQGQLVGQQPGKSGSGGFFWNEYQNVDVKGYSQTPTAPLYSPFPSYGTPAAASWNFASQGIGKLFSNSVYPSIYQTADVYGFVRSGDYGDSQAYGVLSLVLSRFADDTGWPTLGFRMAR